MGRLTTHVLDTSAGKPAAGMKIELWRIGDDPMQLKTLATNEDGRADAPLLDGSDFQTGEYELRFHAGDYLIASGVKLPKPAFLDIIPIRFGIADPDAHYHVPLLLSAHGYSTYRGS
ncbi:MAG: hydroxyisourate hydrolase [Rhizobiales bacterium]|nr:hydroxyisourate hydrolase [Hyphomicrobiales bacterium]